MASPSLTGFGPSATFLENTVNGGPQLIDPNVAFTDPDDNFNGGSLVVSGLLAQDTVAIRNQGAGLGQIGFAAGTVSYEGVAIGTVSGGAGSSLNVTFNSNATSVAIDALIQNLTYANSSDSPTATRSLSIVVTDDTGGSTPTGPSYVQTSQFVTTGGSSSTDSYVPALKDLDGDGDLDMVVGIYNGVITLLTNTGTTANPVFGAPVTISGVTAGAGTTPALGDLNGDGKVDMLLGNLAGNLFISTNTGTSTAPSFGAAVQLPGINLTLGGSLGGVGVALGDLDGDGDLDIVAGNYDGKLYTLINDGTAAAPSFDAPLQIGSIDLGTYAWPTLGDLDGDGDLDIIAGNINSRVYGITNNGTANAPSFGAATQLFNIPSTTYSAPALGDLDGDGDLDLAVATRATIRLFTNSGPPAVTITVTAQDDPAVANDDAFSTSETAVVSAGNIFTNNGSGADADPDGPALSITHINGSPFSAGSQITLASGALLTVNANGTFSYDPNGKFEHLGAAGSGAIAADLTATDSFAYTLAGGDTATVTFTVTGVDNNDTLHGQPSSDTLVPLHGGNGNDKLYAFVNQQSELHGDADNDVLVASGGNDALFGEVGLDWASYETSSAVTVDLVNAANNAGDAAGDTYSGIERFLLSGSNDSFTGSAGADVAWGGLGTDTLTGGAGNDTLNGGEGNDNMAGGANDDVYVVDSVSDVVTELGGGGYDRVNAFVNLTGAHALAAQVEEGRLAGTAQNLDGNALNNRLIGNALDNRLAGGSGVDNVTGNAGADTFVLANTALNRDTLSDFTHASDKLEISSAIFGAGLTAGSLNASLFEANLTGLASSAATRFVYDTDGGQLYFDTNGSTAGGRQLIATLTNLATLTEADFIIV